jgi:hypothetical protein
MMYRVAQDFLSRLRLNGGLCHGIAEEQLEFRAAGPKDLGRRE